ncbi:hypothetical protein BGW38_002269 [Lunasporangiospora selenospora]|uniref:Periplasmic binding protein n=1 Tax=Lunasporangiospora selenospora TaxID=979761 RepID=A0A9P6KDH9_9FUNG|nr:hypothetical protein BGW38_002269 [Lunasporangiospora selenospora]
MAAHSFPTTPEISRTKMPRWTQPVSFYGMGVFGKYYASSICVFLFLVPFLVMPAMGQGTADDPCLAPFDANKDYFPSKISVVDAAFFKVRYEKNYKVVTNTDKNTTFVLTQCNTPVPDASLFSNTTVFVTVPVKKAATSAVPYIELLGRRSTLKVVDTEGMVSSPCVQLGLEKREIIGLEDTDLALRGTQLQGVDVIFTSFGPNMDPATVNKTVITSESADPGPLNRAEWLEFYSTFYNLEEAAQKMTGKINNNYNCFKSRALAEKTKPVIAWTSYDAPASYNNNTASWSISNAPYKRIISEDAGATFFNGTTKSKYTGAAEFAEAVKDVDVLIDETFTGANLTQFLENYNLTEASTLKFIKNKAVFREDGLVNPTDGRDWLEAAVAMDDAVLQDIVRAVHPEIFPKTISYNWIRNIAKNEPKQILTSGNCTVTDADTPIKSRAAECSSSSTAGDRSGAIKIAGSVAMTAIFGLVAAAFSL